MHLLQLRRFFVEIRYLTSAIEFEELAFRLHWNITRDYPGLSDKEHSVDAKANHAGSGNV
jgi:hypothetical protein